MCSPTPLLPLASITLALIVLTSIPGLARAQGVEAGGEVAASEENEAETEAAAEPPTDLLELRQREAVKPWHAAFGTATGISSYALTLLGYLTFNDRYGWDGDPSSTGCATGSPILGAEGCSGIPLAHLIAVSTATTLFSVTFVLSLFMPDPLHFAEGGGELGALLPIHKALRWVLLGLYIGQLVLGAITSNIETTDFGTRRGLASAHLAIGTATMVTMTTQGILGSLMEW